jgi:hypothetical protein
MQLPLAPHLDNNVKQTMKINTREQAAAPVTIASDQG